MRGIAAAGTAVVAVALIVSCGVASGQAAPQPSEQELYKQKLDALEKKVEQLERAAQEKAAVSDETIKKAVQAAAKENEKPGDILVSWKDGILFQSRDKSFMFHVGGRLNYDAAWLGEDSDTRAYVVPATGKALGDQLDGTEARRVRLQFDGTIFNNVFFKIEPDFTGTEKDKNGNTYASSTVTLKDAWIGIRELVPFATVQAGHLREPFSLEELTSSNYNTFMENALPSALVPSYNVGVQLSNSLFGDRVTWAAGAFRETNDRGYGQSEGGSNITARVTALPWYEEDGARLLHVGVSASARGPRDGVQYSTRPEAHLSSKYLDTGVLDSHDVTLLGGEAALVYGPLSLQGECVQSQVKRSAADDVTFTGWYTQVSYFLTGEHRVYKKNAGMFDRVRPRTNFAKKPDGGKGWGAWELAVRYSALDLNDANVHGGRLCDTTVGLNWYLNPNTRIMANYTLANLTDNGATKGGDTGIVGLRLQLDF